MPTFVFPGEGYTLASALRVELERAHPDDLVVCDLRHPLDPHLTVLAPSEKDLRAALLRLRERLRRVRCHLADSTPRCGV